MNQIKVENITKNIKDSVILREVSLEAEGGKIVGIVGENGSGKSMLFRVMAGLIHPTEGQVLYNGKTYTAGRPKIGLVIDDVSLYPDFTGKKNLELLAMIRKMADESMIEDAIKRVGLDPKDKRSFRKYSLGMKHRLLLAQAIMEKPDFLFLDEPTNAVDAEGVQVFYQIIKEEAERGAVVIVSSHVNSDIQTLAEKTYLMDKGKLSVKNV